jgi:hypothetical protein
MLLACVAMTLLSGCGASSQTSLTDAEAHAGGNPASLVRGEQQSASYQGAQPSQVQIPELGSATYPGSAALIGFGELRMVSPKDVTAAKIAYTPEPKAGKPAIVIQDLEANISDVAAIRREQFAAAMAAIQGMTESEAKRRIEQMREGGEIGEDVAASLIEHVVPLLGG